MADTILRGVSNDGTIRIFAAETTELVGRAQQIHHSYPIATAALWAAFDGSGDDGDDAKGRARYNYAAREGATARSRACSQSAMQRARSKATASIRARCCRTKYRASSMSAAQSAREHSRLSATSG